MSLLALDNCIGIPAHPGADLPTWFRLHGAFEQLSASTIIISGVIARVFSSEAENVACGCDRPLGYEGLAMDSLWK